MKKKIILSICITYYFERDHIYELLNYIRKIKKKNLLEVIIRNDNPKKKLSLKSFKINNLNIRIFNSKKKAIGEVSSLLYMKSKSNGKFICFLADDDLISPKFFDFFLNDKIKSSNYLCHSTPNKKDWGLKNHYNFINKKKLVKDFLGKKIYLSGCVGMIIKKSQINEYHIKKLKNYNFDLYLLLFLLSRYDLKFINFNYGFNNISASMISSKAINPKNYYSGLKFLKTIISDDINFLFYKFFMNNYYSNMFRENSKKLENIIFIIKFYLLFNKKSNNKFLGIKYLIYILIKIFIKLIFNFLKKIT